MKVTSTLGRFAKVFCVLAVLSAFVLNAYAGDDKKRVVLQAFWWDYYNSNFDDAYANDLTELAPRLKEIGINAVWVPPFCKNSGTNSVGYAPFDYYDLGDKYQKGRTDKRAAANATRMGTKDDLLRMIAVMHANGIEVICDGVLNHTTDPGGEDGGAGGQDPAAWDDKWKNFRYVCYETPYKDGGANDYLSRKGRWPKNWENFHPNEGHNCNDGDWCSAWWGPDNCFYEGAYGQSSNAIYNPAQGPNYMLNNAREWAKWLKKQTGVDGFRWDAVKHFPEWVQQDVSWNIKYGMSDWCNGGEDMFNIGEFIGGKDEIDGYTDRVMHANGGDEFLMGAFDVPLHSSVMGVGRGEGYGNVGSVVNDQLGMRYAVYGDGHKVHRSTNYINSHDNFRPTLDDKGNYVSFSDDMGGPLDPRNWRMPMAYAILSALDGNLCVYMEDLFNLNNSNRWTHHPASATELPVRQDIVNIIKAHQMLNYKWGDYKVRWQDEDLLIIERSGRALIAISDAGGDNWHNTWVDSDFRDVDLKDYMGYSGGNPHAWSDGRVELWVPPVTGYGKGVAIWAPAGATGYTPYRSHTTVQEWEMADDLGDSHCKSLGQGGQLPAKSCAQRLVGKIYAASGKKITAIMHPANNGNDITLALYDLDGNLLAKANGTKDVTVNYTPTASGWVAMKVWNNSAQNIGQKCWVRASYEAPASVSNTMSDRADTRASVWTGKMGTTDWTDCGNWEQGMTPTANSKVVIPDNGDVRPVITGNVTIKELLVEKGKGSIEKPDISVTGSLKVTSSSTCLEGTAYICGNAILGTTEGDFNNCTVDVETLAADADFTVFPSPADEKLTITSSYLPKENITIMNLTGQVVKQIKMEQTIETIDVSNLTSGIYIVTDGTNVKRFIKR